MDRRIFGLENEYGVTCTFRGQRRLSPDEVARYLFRRVVSWGRSSNVFLRNGARLYLDVGSHPEYATPECDNVVDLVTHDKAGERILEGLLVDADRRLREEGIAGDIYLFKNNTDSAGNSYGCHENYLVGRHGEFGRLADILIPFLVTRQIICGAGKVLQTPRGAVYCVSQRAEHIWEGVSSATTRSRPIINTRDEPHADAERFRRLHVIVGDSNMSETTMLLKVGATDLVIHDKAGERILEGLLVDADRRLREEGIAGDIYLFKNNTDSAGNSYGCHENYLVGRHGEFGRLADILIPFLVTRQVICGAGKVLQTPRGAVYCVSQRAEHIWEGVSSATTRSRPIINTRDEPHADAERY
ncbi:MAG: proteasome accessory factor PafA2 family protein, partial [Trebonia sp.]|uniref:proteasome accessory factor PafA2 family protein n=1 Tax=Trebonia sp. TaxID=2767075 RepID=UPI003C93AB8F